MRGTGTNLQGKVQDPCMKSTKFFKVPFLQQFATFFIHSRKTIPRWSGGYQRKEDQSTQFKFSFVGSALVPFPSGAEVKSLCKMTRNDLKIDEPFYSEVVKDAFRARIKIEKKN